MPGRATTRATPGTRLEAWLDGAGDGVLAAFAVWTVAYEVAVVTERSVWTLGALWLPVAAALALLGAWTAQVARAEPAMVVSGHPVQPPSGHRGLTSALVVLLVAAVVLRDQLGMVPASVVGLALLGLALVSRPHDQPEPEPEPTAGRTYLAVVVSLGVAVFASFLRRPDADDAFYVNRSTWVAEHGVPAVRDTMFGPETFPSTYGRGVPFPSVESLFGALAHLVDVSAATLCYVVVVPVLAFAAAWGAWRLVRAWTATRAMPVFLVTLLVVAMSGDAIAGSYSVGRIWQGKVIAFAILSPMVWVYFRDLAAGGSLAARRARVMLLLAGIGLAGLTSATPLLAPSYAGAALLAAAVLRNRSLVLGGLLFLAGPLAAASTVFLGKQSFVSQDSEQLTARDTFNILMSVDSTAMAVLGTLALVVAVRWLRPEAAVLAACASFAALLALLPGVLDLAGEVTGGGSIVWRLVLLVPLAVLTAVLLVEGVARFAPSPMTRLVSAVVLAAVLALGGRTLWQGDGADFASPGWKADRAALDDVKAVLDLDAGDGSLMLPADQSQVLATYTTERFATVPRFKYVAALDDTDERISARYALFGWLEGGYPLFARGVRDRLDLLDVAVLCVPADDEDLTEQLEQVAAETAAPVLPAGSLTCATRQGSAWA